MPATGNALANELANCLKTTAVMPSLSLPGGRSRKDERGGDPPACGHLPDFLEVDVQMIRLKVGLL